MDHTDALQLLQNEIGALARDPSFNLRIVAAVAAHSAASAGLLQFFKDHCLSFLLVLKADKVRCVRRQCFVVERRVMMRSAGAQRATSCNWGICAAGTHGRALVQSGWGAVQCR
jgi:hypothetical protein